MMVAAGAMPPVAEKTSGVKEPISISRTLALLAPGYEASAWSRAYCAITIMASNT